MSKIENLPPNPYTRSPIKDPEYLAGRSQEKKAIHYYLSLTAAGQSPHLALIGQRGVGKTSLLNAAESIALDLKLLPIRIDLNQGKTRSAKAFWKDVYNTLILSLAKVNCWGGIGGPIYPTLLQMANGRLPNNMDDVILQGLYAFACQYSDNNDAFDCSDSFVVYDFEVCIEELKQRGYAGIALLMDEADCLGQNVEILQLLRNVFQRVNGCSLVLAGTEAVFPTLSDVFSPIPRQFHRIDVQPFASWSETFALVTKPIHKLNIQDINPGLEVVQDLHSLCSGDPSEVQLYCHHMYKCVEEGESERMALAPHVFRNVLTEYRKNVSSGVGAVLNAIEELPDGLLYESRWLSRRALSCDENVHIEILRREMKSAQPLTEEQRNLLRSEICTGYETLFQKGISEEKERVKLSGDPLTSGFWKSYVEVEKGKRWTWDYSSFMECISKVIVGFVRKSVGNKGIMELPFVEDDFRILGEMRRGDEPSSTEAIEQLLFSTMIARTMDRGVALDVSLSIECRNSRNDTKIRLYEKSLEGPDKAYIEDLLGAKSQILTANEVKVSVLSVERWELPTPEEVKQLVQISGVSVPRFLQYDDWDRAVDLFKEGKIAEATEVFADLAIKNESSQTLNNLAFCQLILGRVDEAHVNSRKAIQLSDEQEYDPLYELNFGLAQFLSGERDKAVVTLHKALDFCRTVKDRSRLEEILYVLVVDKTLSKVEYYSEMPVDVALLINLWLMQCLTKDEVLAEIKRYYPDRYAKWEEYIQSREPLSMNHE